MHVCRHPDVVIDAMVDHAKWTEPSQTGHSGRQIMAMMVQQLLLAEYMPEKPSLPAWFDATLPCDACKRTSVQLCFEKDRKLR